MELSNNNPCTNCGRSVERSGKRGRPFLKCERCRIKTNPSPSHGIGRSMAQDKSHKGRRFDRGTKRDHQQNCYLAVKDHYGIRSGEKIPAPFSIASLCDDQTGPNSQYKNIVDTLIDKPSQYIGFCYDDSTSAELESSREKIRQNSIAHPEAHWEHLDMCSKEGLQLMLDNNTLVVDYDACASLTNERVKSNLSSLFQSIESRGVIILANFWAENKYTTTVHDPRDSLNHLKGIPGFEAWETIRCEAFGDSWFREYQSETDPRYRYRTVLLQKR